MEKTYKPVVLIAIAALAVAVVITSNLPTATTAVAPDVKPLLTIEKYPLTNIEPFANDGAIFMGDVKLVLKWKCVPLRYYGIYHSYFGSNGVHGLIYKYYAKETNGVWMTGRVYGFDEGHYEVRLLP